MTFLRYNYYRLSRHWECFDGRNGHFITFKNENFWFEKKNFVRDTRSKNRLAGHFKIRIFQKFFLHVNKHPKYFKKNQSDKIHRQIWRYSRWSFWIEATYMLRFNSGIFRNFTQMSFLYKSTNLEFLNLNFIIRGYIKDDSLDKTSISGFWL